MLVWVVVTGSGAGRVTEWMRRRNVYSGAFEAAGDCLERRGIRSPIDLARWIWRREEWRRSAKRA
eukprot:11634704-Alexandrium_andersonii.AAC.1